MEQNENIAMPVMDSGKQSNGKGLKITTTIAFVVAVCGVGFGVYGMVQSLQKDSQISDLKVQIKDDTGTVTTIETPEIDTTDNETTVTIVDSMAKNENSSDYIYIGNWGTKIKVPEDLTIVNYSFVNNGYHKTCSVVYVSAVTTSDGLESITNTDDWDYTLGAVTRCPIEDKYYYGTLVFSDDKYDYYYDSSSVTGKPQWMQNSVGLVKDMLTTRENYSAF